jgi:hypothetical protein
MEDCAGQASVLVIATPWKQFAALRPEHLSKSGRPILIDWWGMLKPAEFAGAADYIACGQGPAVGAAAERKAAVIASA